MRYSASPLDPGYENYLALGERRYLLQVLLNGEPLRFARAADDEEGWAEVFLNEMENGSITKIVQGKITFEFKEPEMNQIDVESRFEDVTQRVKDAADGILEYGKALSRFLQKNENSFLALANVVRSVIDGRVHHERLQRESWMRRRHGKRIKL